MKAKPVRLTLVLAALLGGGVSAGVLAERDTNRVVTRTVTAAGAPIPATTAASSTTAMTAGAIYRQASKGVVDILVQTSGDGSGRFGPPGQTGQTGKVEGTGFLIDRQGDIVTNQHVVDGATSATVTFSDGQTATARVLATDASTDLAVLRVRRAAGELHPLALADSSQVLVGDTVLAIGSPFGLSETLTQGIVSSLHRSIQSPDNSTISGAIQTDASVNEGNSGGPLLDTAGRVIGVNAQIATNSGGNDGIAFAIPSNTVQRVVSRLLARATPGQV